MQNISYENGAIYKEKIAKIIENTGLEENFQYLQKLLQEAINEANVVSLGIVKSQYLIKFSLSINFQEVLLIFQFTENEALKQINKALEQDDFQTFCETILNPNLELYNDIDEFALPLYFEEMKIDCTESQV